MSTTTLKSYFTRVDLATYYNNNPTPLSIDTRERLVGGEMEEYANFSHVRNALDGGLVRCFGWWLGSLVRWLRVL